MKRQIAVCLTAAALVIGCSPTPQGGGPTQTRESDWVQTVVIDGVQRNGRTLLVSGRAAPGARVVLRGGSGAAFAASADGRGTFTMRMTAPSTHQLFRAEIQTGQDVARGLDWLLVTPDPSGVVAVLRPGDATRRLDRRGLIEAVDMDERALLASGQAQAGSEVVVAVNGQPAATVRTDAQGRWTAGLGSRPAGPTRLSVSVAGASADVTVPEGPSSQAQPAGLTVVTRPEGVQVGWTGPDGAMQRAWFPALGVPLS